MKQRSQSTPEDTLAWTAREQDEEPYSDLTGHDPRRFPGRAAAGPRRDGRGLPGPPGQPEPPGRPEGAPPRPAVQADLLEPVRGRGDGRRQAQPPQHRPHLHAGQRRRVRFIAMEYVQGTNLREYLRRRGRSTCRWPCRSCGRRARPSARRARSGLIHRDIKPENLLLTSKGQVKVADFGLCRDLDADRIHLTQPGMTMGTPLYMSPEQAQGQALDHRSDLYSLGVTFYHMLAGEPPFRAETAVALALKHVSDTPVSLARPPARPPARARSAGHEADGQGPGRPLPVGRRDARDLARIRELDCRPRAGDRRRRDRDALATVDAAPPSAVRRPSGRRLRDRLDRPRSPRWRPAAGSAGRAGAGRSSPAWSRAGRRLARGPRRPARPASAAAARRPARRSGIEPRLDGHPQAGRAPRSSIATPSSAPRRRPEAAWLAVPGYFPSSREWASPAYIQLAAWLYRRRDVDRLTALRRRDRRAGRRRRPRRRGAGRDHQAGASSCSTSDLDGVIEEHEPSLEPR